MLGLQHAADPWERATVDRRRRRTPALVIHRVVGLVVPGEDAAHLGGTVEPAALADGDPAGDVLVSLVEDDESSRDLGGVLQDSPGLRGRESAVVHEAAEVVFAEYGGPGDLAPALHHRELLWCGQLVERRQAGIRRLDGPRESVSQLLGRPA